jgi:CheY-like chemotaxis protein
MNGFEASARIRQLEQQAGAGARIPNIAMTAHAMRGAREECLRHGMDAYLTKPIDTDALWQELDGLAQDGQAVASEQRPVMPPELAQDTPPAVVADFARARQTMDGDLALFDELAQMCLRDVPAQLALAHDSLAQADPLALREAAHAIKGMVSMFGADRTERAAAALEKLAPDLPRAAGALAELDHAVGEFMTALHNHRW